MGKGKPPPSAKASPLPWFPIDRQAVFCLFCRLCCAICRSFCNPLWIPVCRKTFATAFVGCEPKWVFDVFNHRKVSGMHTTEACPSKTIRCKDSKSTVSSLILCTGTNPPSGPPMCMALTPCLNPCPNSLTTVESGVPCLPHRCQVC